MKWIEVGERGEEKKNILKLYKGGGRGGEHIIQGFEEDNLPGDMMSGAELTEIPNLGELGENRLIPRTDYEEGVRVENPMSPAVEGGPLELELKDVTFRSTTDQFLRNEVKRRETWTWRGKEKGEG